MNLNSCDIRRLNKLVFQSTLSLALLLKLLFVAWAGSVCLHFVCSVTLRSGVHFFAVHSVFHCFGRDICLLLKLLLRVRNVLKHSEGRSSFASLILKYQRRDPQPERWRFPFALKQSDTKTNLPQKHPRNARVTSAEELGTMCKNNLRSFHWNRTYTEIFFKLCLLIVYIIGT